MNLERNILEKLNLVHPRMLSERVLLQDVRLDDPQVSQGDLRGAISALESKGQIIALSGEDVKRLKITTDGKARLLE